MIKRFFFFISALVFLYGSTSFSTASYSLTTHTQHTPIELKPAFLNSEGAFQVASVCFLGSGDGCGDGGFDKGNSDYEIDAVNQCKNDGYTISFCPLPTYPVGQCPYDSGLFLKCEIDNERACKESGFQAEDCATGEVVDVSCPYNSNYKKCKCNPCDGYDYTYAQATVMGYVADGSCQSCGETKYKRKENPCSGYMTCECGGEIGASVCYTGSVQKFDKCKTCCENKCILDSCPNTHFCEYEACSDRYCDKGCPTDYTLKNGICSPKCQMGWIYYNDNTCSADLVGGKTALGVVLYINPDGVGGQAIAPNNIGLYQWSTRDENIAALPDYISPDQAKTDFNSCSNTSIMISAVGSPAAYAARNYAPTNESKGKWCVPAMGVLVNIINVNVKNGISKLGGNVDKKPNLLSSSESYDDWIAYLEYSNINGYYKRSKYGVQPVIEF